MKSCFVFSFFFFNLSPFSFWQISICFRIANCCCLFSASVTASRWRSLFSSNVSLAFPYSPVARLSPYSNGINTPSFSKTSNKAILTPERTGNISTSWPAACFIIQSPKTAYLSSLTEKLRVILWHRLCAAHLLWVPRRLAFLCAWAPLVCSQVCATGSFPG